MLGDEGVIISRIKGVHMDQNLENLIRERAYKIWTSHGCVHGQADQHWLAAEREILTASTTTLPGKPSPQKKRSSSARMRIGSRPRAHARARSKNYAYQNWSARS